MTHECGSSAESQICKILSFPTADRRFDTKVKCPTGWASFWVKFPTVRSLTRVKCPGIARGGGWAVLELIWSGGREWVNYLSLKFRQWTACLGLLTVGPVRKEITCQTVKTIRKHFSQGMDNNNDFQHFSADIHQLVSNIILVNNLWPFFWQCKLPWQ